MSQKLSADVVVIGAGAAGMYAAIAAKRKGADVLLVDKSFVGRGGATPMAQMTVAAAMGHAEPDDPETHFQDTVAAGKGTVVEPLAELLCFDGPERILDTRKMGVNWAADGEKIRQVKAPGHSRFRCCYVDVLATGTGIASGMRKELTRLQIRQASGLFVTDLIKDASGAIAGAAAFDVNEGQTFEIWAPTVVLACGGLTQIFERNSASCTMTADAHALAARAGGALLDMEMVQFFPIANLYPRLVGLDPIMWDPFRYRLGGRLWNGNKEEFVQRYAGVADEGQYTATRDVLSLAILKEAEAGRGSPHGGAWLDFQEIPEEKMVEAFAPVVKKLKEQGIDLTKRSIEVAPMAHYMIRGVEAGADMNCGPAGLFACGEAVGGAHGANRLSGNAITEALTFGHRAGDRAAESAAERGRSDPDGASREAMRAALSRIEQVRGRNEDSSITLPALLLELQQAMWKKAGPLRTKESLDEMERTLEELRGEKLAAARVGGSHLYNREWMEYFEMDHMLLASQAILLGAKMRRESRGAHRREDFPKADEAFAKNTRLTLTDKGFAHAFIPVAKRDRSTEEARP